MQKPRLGHIQFLNCLPLYYGLVKNDVLLDVDLIKADPKDLAVSLVAGDLDIAPIPAIEYARHADDLVLLPDIAISSDGPVQSILLLSKRPAEELEGATVALTSSSRTSQVLTRILLAKRWEVSASYTEMPPDLGAMLRDADAALLIGDDALRAYWDKPDGVLEYDLGTEWTAWTGLPMVYAVWAVRREFAETQPNAVREVIGQLDGSLGYCREHLDDISEYAARWESFPPERFRSYFDALQFRFEPRYREGLVRYLQEAHDDRAARRGSRAHHLRREAGVAEPLDDDAAWGPRGRRRDRELRRRRHVAAHPGPGGHAAARRRPARPGRCRLGDAPPACARRRGHLHRRPQRQLHQRLRLRLPLLRVLPLGRGLRRLRPDPRGARRPKSPRPSIWMAPPSCCRAACIPTWASSGTRACSPTSRPTTRVSTCTASALPRSSTSPGISGITTREVLSRLSAAGLDSLPGGGAEILVDRVRGHVSPKKATSDEWLGVMREAHQLDISTTATMMFGGVETVEERVEHMARVREVQDEAVAAGHVGFRAFIPWSFQPGNTALAEDEYTASGEWMTAASGWEYLRTLAVSRLFLDSVTNIQASWVTQGAKVGQVALAFGANDMGSTMIEENVVAAAGTKFMLAREELVRLVADAGYTPVQRDTLYREVRRF